MSSGEPQLVSVIIPSYNHAGFVGGTIESVLGQTHRRYEIIVVDDGSTDNSLEVIARYPGLHCISQKNQGVAAARNRGLRESTGDYVVFLDSDDRLLPEALEVGVNCLNAYPEYGFVAGRCNHIAIDGSFLRPARPPSDEKDFYLRLLVHDSPRCPAVVMFRCSVFESVGGFNASDSIRGAEDYDLYLRAAKKFPAYGHNKVVAEKRSHGANVSSNYAQMLRSVVNVYRSQWSYLKGNVQYEKAYRGGLRVVQEAWGTPLIDEGFRGRPDVEGRKQALQDLMTLLRYHPRGFATFIRRALVYRLRNLRQK